MCVLKPCCSVCGEVVETGVVLCGYCSKDYRKRLEWLEDVGMPALGDVAYKRVSLASRTEIYTRSPFPSAPLNQTAYMAYENAEGFLQRLGAKARIAPFVADERGTTRTVLKWHWLLPLLEDRVVMLCSLGTAGCDYRGLTKVCERVESFIVRPASRKLIGICPECIKMLDENGDQTRTAIYSIEGEAYSVCPECGAFLNLKQVRHEYVEAAKQKDLHITRTRKGAADWVRETLGVSVTPKQLDNWRVRGYLHPKKVEGRYWEWDVMELSQKVWEYRDSQ